MLRRRRGKVLTIRRRPRFAARWKPDNTWHKTGTRDLEQRYEDWIKLAVASYLRTGSGDDFLDDVTSRTIYPEVVDDAEAFLTRYERELSSWADAVERDAARLAKEIAQTVYRW